MGSIPTSPAIFLAGKFCGGTTLSYGGRSRVQIPLPLPWAGGGTVDAAGLNPARSNPVWVQIPPGSPTLAIINCTGEWRNGRRAGLRNQSFGVWVQIPPRSPFNLETKDVIMKQWLYRTFLFPIFQFMLNLNTNRYNRDFDENITFTLHPDNGYHLVIGDRGDDSNYSNDWIVTNGWRRTKDFLTYMNFTWEEILTVPFTLEIGTALKVEPSMGNLEIVEKLSE